MRSVTFSPPPPIQMRQALLDGLRLAPGVAQGEELAVEVGDVLGEQAAHALDALVELRSRTGAGGNGMP